VIIGLPSASMMVLQIKLSGTLMPTVFLFCFNNLGTFEFASKIKVYGPGNAFFITLNNEFEIGDYFGIGALASENSEFIYQTINSEQTYWVITNAAKDVDEWNREI
jgi:hypothetical protein